MTLQPTHNPVMKHYHGREEDCREPHELNHKVDHGSSFAHHRGYQKSPQKESYGWKPVLIPYACHCLQEQHK